MPTSITQQDNEKGTVHDAIWDTSSIQYTSIKFSYFGKPSRLKTYANLESLKPMRTRSNPIRFCPDKPNLTWSELENPDVLDCAIQDAVKHFDTTAWIGKGRRLTKSLSVIENRTGLYTFDKYILKPT